MLTKNWDGQNVNHNKKSGQNANLWLALRPVGILSAHPYEKVRKNLGRALPPPPSASFGQNQKEQQFFFVSPTLMINNLNITINVKISVTFNISINKNFIINSTSIKYNHSKVAKVARRAYAKKFGLRQKF